MAQQPLTPPSIFNIESTRACVPWLVSRAKKRRRNSAVPVHRTRAVDNSARSVDKVAVLEIRKFASEESPTGKFISRPTDNHGRLLSRVQVCPTLVPLSWIFTFPD